MTTVTLALLLAGCAQLEQRQTLEQLHSEVQLLQETLARSEQQMDSIKTLELQSEADLHAQIAGLNNNLANLSEQVKKTCAQPPPRMQPAAPQKCAPGSAVVIHNSDKMVLGEIETVRLEPPGLNVIARIDSGASSSSLDADKVTEFERDGDDWVRFDVTVNDKVVTIERQVERYVRVIQQADKEGTRRPVVLMRIVLGNVTDTYEFTLADRSHLEHGMILGRNFLTDLALIDVSRQFVQPSQKPKS
jgi:outer membrane murein-binding lipoprotein Lpp